MKLGVTVNLGGYQSMKYESSEHPNNQDCVRDLIVQMQPMAAAYPTVRAKIDEMKKMYNVS